MNNRIGFWSVLALVIGSQIGSGVFMLPASLAPLGIFSIAGWIVSAIGAISLAIVFASLCAKFPKTGGPHAYIQQLFGRDVAFFAGWTYWIISWVSSSVVVIAAIGYLSPFIGEQSSFLYLTLEVILLISITSLNLYGVSTAGKAETVFTLLKFLPLFIVPIAAIWHFDINNFEVREANDMHGNLSLVAQAALLTLWGFIGVESGTTPAGSVENPSKTIPRAIIIGTTIVALVYIFNSVAIMGIVEGSELANSNAPYVDVTKHLFGGNWHLWIAIAASIVCIGTLNAWILTSGQISLGLAEDKLLPEVFGRCNKKCSPYFSILCSCLGIAPLLYLTSNQSIAKQVTAVIDFSVTSFLFIYLLCSIVNLVLCRKSTLNALNSLISILFCTWVIFETPLNTIIISSFFTLSGVPLYFFWYRKNKVA